MTTQQLNTKTVLANSNVAFGTSGARGLVTDFTPQVCAAFTHAFISAMQDSFVFDTLALAIDNRPSSVEMAMACAKAAEQVNVSVVYYGVVPTPALAFIAAKNNMPCIMVTGSHIPFDRNGLKFYRPDGEISKADEKAILNADYAFEAFDTMAALTINPEAAVQYKARYTSLFDNKPLTGKHIGIYEHSSAGRDLYQDIFTALGAKVTPLERTNTFVPIDTEAVSEEDCLKAQNWSKEYGFDTIFSTDGDGDRPLVADENGNWLRGDILGLICAKELAVSALAVPVSCNTAIEQSKAFDSVVRTKIGSPYVIAEFDALSQNYDSVAGFEANGGFLLGTDTTINDQMLEKLPTRDAVLPAVIAMVGAKYSSLSQVVNDLPKRFTASDRIKSFATEKSKAIIAKATQNTAQLLTELGFTDQKVMQVDTTDGLRITFESADVIHLRPSGNAPELRCYAEANAVEIARNYVSQVLNNIQKL